MKIINQGTDPKDTPLRGHCIKCSTVFECEREEARKSSYTVGLIFRTTYPIWLIACPVCRDEVKMPDPENYEVSDY